MPDISMCANINCPFNKGCYRYTARPNPFRQSYGSFVYDETKGCNYYWPNTNYYRYKYNLKHNQTIIK